MAGLCLLDGNAAIQQRLDAAPAAVEAVIANRAAWLADAASLLDTGREIHILADGFHAGLAEQAALMLREAPRIAAIPFDTGDWLHVGLYTLLPGDGVVLFAGSAADDEAITTIHARGARVVVAGPVRDGADVWIPVGGDAVPLQLAHALAVSVVAELLAAELWRRAGMTAAAPAAPPARLT